MALFSARYPKKQTGINADEPRKTGFPRFAEVFRRDFGNLCKLSLLLFVFCAPAFAVFILALFLPGHPLFFAAIAVFASIPVGSAITAACFCVSKMLRDDSGFIGYDFFRKVKENFRTTTLPGMAYTLLTMAQVYSFILFLAGGFWNVHLFVLAFWGISVLLTGATGSYFYLQAGYLTLSAKNLLKNSLLLGFANLPRSILCFLSGIAAPMIIVLLWPASLLLLIFMAVIGYSLSVFAGVMWIWPVVDGQFKIEETIRAKQ